jgi:uncharacterized protein YjiS (DUF1127 family)
MLMRVIDGTFRCWRETRQRKAAIRDLRALSDRTLKDMGLTRGEIVAAAHGQVYRGEPVRPHEPTPPPSLCTPMTACVDPIDPAALRGHLDRARQRRAEFIAGLLRRGLGGMLRLLRPAVSAPRRPGGGLSPLDPPAGHHKPIR